MALQQALSISLALVGDGTSTVFVFDLLSDPYLTGGFGGNVNLITNWPSIPDAVNTETSGFTATISGHKITVTAATALTAGQVAGVLVVLLFNSR